MLKICIAGATGWVGQALSKSLLQKADIQLTAGLSRSYAGRDLLEVLRLDGPPIPLFGHVTEALDAADFDVLIDFTNPTIAKSNVLAALKKGKRVILGTSGLSDADFEDIEQVASEKNSSVLAAGNFAITAVLLQRFAEMAARYIPEYELIDYAAAGKQDAPSGTVAELAYRLSLVQKPKIEVDIAATIGRKDARGATINGIQVHAVRLPGHVLAVEAIFGAKDEKLLLRHDAGSGADPYIQGILLAIQKINTFTGLRRGLDTVMDF